MPNSVTGVVAASLLCFACSGTSSSRSNSGGTLSTVAGSSNIAAGGEMNLTSGGATDFGIGGNAAATGGSASPLTTGTQTPPQGGTPGAGGANPAGGETSGALGGAHATGGRTNGALGGTNATGGKTTGVQGGAKPTGGKASTGGLPASSGGQPSSTGGTTGTSAAPTVYGDPVSGQYHLGPVDFAETEWANACTPTGGYRQELRDETGLGGEFLAGLATQYAQAGGTCDACIVINTATGRQIIARVVTYGTENAAGDIDVSPSVFDALNTGEYPRSMTWQFAKCPDTGPLEYEFQTEANPWWTSLWVRNPRVPITKVEVKSANHADFFTLRRETDGTLNDDNGFGEGSFTLRITGMDGQVITDTLPGFSAGELVVSTKQFQ